MSPKAGVVLGPWKGTEIYANAGADSTATTRGARRSPCDPHAAHPAERVTPLARATGAEVGLRTVRLRGLQSTLALWTLGLDSELLFVGDAGTTEAGRPSRRAGIEWANYYTPRPWLISTAMCPSRAGASPTATRPATISLARSKPWCRPA